jgi:hypothetical protein
MNAPAVWARRDAPASMTISSVNPTLRIDDPYFFADVPAAMFFIFC